MTDEMRAAINKAAAALQHQFAQKPLLPRELADAVVFYDTIMIHGRPDLLIALRAMPDPAAAVLEVIRG